MSDLQGWAAILLGVAAVGTLITALYKLRPESARIFVDSAKVSVEMSDNLRDDLHAERLRLREDITDLRQRMAVCEASRIAAEVKNSYLEKAFRDVLRELHDEHGIDLHVRLDPPDDLPPAITRHQD